MRRRRSAPWHRPLTRARGTQREVVVFPPSGPSPRAGACSRGMIGASPWYPVEFTLRRSPPVRRAISTSRWTGARPRSPRPRRKMLKPQWGSGLKNCHTSCVSPCLNRQSPVRNRRFCLWVISLRCRHEASAVQGARSRADGAVNSDTKVVASFEPLVMTTRAALRAAFGAVKPGSATRLAWGSGVRATPARFAPKSLDRRWKGDDASPGGGFDSMRGLPEMRTPIMEEQAIPATEDELAKRRAAALRAWLEREMGTERAALTALLAKHGVKMKVGLSTTRTSRLI